MKVNMQYADRLDKYYKEYISGFTLYRVIPALPKDHDDSQSYYSCPSIEDNDVRYGVAFVRDDTKIIEEYKNNPEKNFWNCQAFIFGSENQYLYDYDNGKFARGLFYEDIRSHIIDHPHVLFFQGCDDGHVGLRFKTKEALLEFVDVLAIFEEVFSVTEYRYGIPKKDLLYIKEQTGESVAVMFENTLQCHN